MAFYRQPFVVLTLCLSLGILAGNFLLNESWTLLLLSLNLVVLSAIFYKVKFYRLLKPTFLIVFLFLGALLLKLNRIEKCNSIFQDTGKQTFHLTLEEVNSGKGEWKKMLVRCDAVLVDDSMHTLNERILLFTKSELLSEGDQIIARFQPEEIKNKGNPGEFDLASYWLNKDISKMGFIAEEDFVFFNSVEIGYWKKMVKNIRAQLKSVLSFYFKGPELGVANALILGDKGDLSSEIRASFSNAGAMHVLAVSGLHVGILLYMLVFILSKFAKVISKNQSVLISVLLIWVYAAVTGFSPSVLRASLMFSILALGQRYGHASNSLNTLAFSAFVLLLCNPLYLFDLGFQLSYLAMIGILVLYLPVSRLVLIKNKWIKKIWEGTAVGIAAQIFTMPITLYYFHQFPNYFVLSNIGLMLITGIVLGAGLLLLSIHHVAILGKIVALSLGLSIGVLLYFVQFVESIPGAVAKGFELNIFHVVISYFVLIGILTIPARNYLKAAAFLLVLAMIQFDRSKNLSVNEFVIFNENKLVTALKIRNEIICIHNENDDRIDRVRYLIDNYSKIRPGKVTYHKLKEGKMTFHIFDSQISFESKTEGIMISLPTERIFIRTKYGTYEEDQSQVVALPYLELEKGIRNLKDGAIVKPI